MISKILSTFYASMTLLMIPYAAQALPFLINPKTGTNLPTHLAEGQTTNAYYTITNNTISLRNGNFIKYLPTNVKQITTDPSIHDLCGAHLLIKTASYVRR